jgi:hypothetical protein
VLLVVAGDDAVSGELRSVGQDVVGVRLAGAPAVMAYIPVGAIIEVVLDG